LSLPLKWNPIKPRGHCVICIASSALRADLA
jgi:hypothetical protein